MLKLKKNLKNVIEYIKSSENLNEQEEIKNNFLNELIKSISFVQSNEKKLLNLQNDNYHLFDDFIDKYLEMNENQNEEVDEILERNIQKFEKSKEIKENMSLMQKKYFEIQKQKNEIDIKEKKLQIEINSKTIKENKNDIETNLKLAESIKKKLAKCLGVKKKIISINSNQNEEEFIKLKEKYSEYLFSYFKEVIDESKTFNQHSNNSSIFSRSLIKMMAKDSLPPSKRENEIMFPTLNKIESEIEVQQNNISKISDKLTLTENHHKTLLKEKSELDSNINEIIFQNNQIEKEIKETQKIFFNLKQELKFPSKIQKKSFNEIYNMIKKNLN